MIFKCIPTGMLSSNCYVIGDLGEGVVIDPGTECDEIVEAASGNGLEIKYIILTHAHLDHICSVDKLRGKTNAKVLIHEADADALLDSRLNGSALFGLSNTFRVADILLKDGDVFYAGGLKLEIIHTPGHTPGGICIKAGNCIFTGDTLFRMSIGRTDLGNGSYDDLISSISGRLMKEGDDTVIYPGHGASSTIGYERKNNPFV